MHKLELVWFYVSVSVFDPLTNLIAGSSDLYKTQDGVMVTRRE